MLGEPSAPLRCTPGRGGAWLRAFAGAADRNALDAIARVLVAARLEPRPTPHDNAVTPLLLAVCAAARARDPTVEIAYAPDARRASPEAYCSGFIAVAEEIVRLPPERAGPLVRWKATR